MSGGRPTRRWAARPARGWPRLPGSKLRPAQQFEPWLSISGAKSDALVKPLKSQHSLEYTAATPCCGGTTILTSSTTCRVFVGETVASAGGRDRRVDTTVPWTTRESECPARPPRTTRIKLCSCSSLLSPPFTSRTHAGTGRHRHCCRRFLPAPS